MTDNPCHRFSVLQRRHFELPSDLPPCCTLKSPAKDLNASSRSKPTSHHQGSSKHPGDEVDLSSPFAQMGDSEDLNYGTLLEDFPGLRKEDDAFAEFLHDEPPATGGTSTIDSHINPGLADVSTINDAAHADSNAFSDLDFNFNANSSSAEGVPDRSSNQSLWYDDAMSGYEDAMSLDIGPNLDFQVPASASASTPWQPTESEAQPSHARNQRLTITVDDANEPDVAAIVSAVLQTNAKVTVQRK